MRHLFGRDTSDAGAHWHWYGSQIAENSRGRAASGRRQLANEFRQKAAGHQKTGTNDPTTVVRGADEHILRMGASWN